MLVLEQDVLIRAAITDYLRSCGYRVLEARNAAEALTILQASSEPIRVVLSAAENGFKLSAWLKANRPNTRMIWATNAERAAQAAGDLCEAGPQRKRPYDPQLLVQQIKAYLARGDAE